MDEDLSYEYTESFDCFVSGSSTNVKSVATELEGCNASIASCSADIDCLSPLPTDRSCRWTVSPSSAERRTSNLSASRSELRFSRYFSEPGNYSADFTDSSTDLNPCDSLLESLSRGSKDESDEDEEDLTACSAASETDTRTCSSVSQEPSIRWKDGDEVDEFSSNSQHLSSQDCFDVFR